MNDVLKKAKRYTAAKHNIFICETLLYIIICLIFQLSGSSTRLASWLFGVSKNYYIVISVYIFILGLLLGIPTFPLDFFGSYKLEHIFGLSRQNFFSWLKDYIKRTLITGIVYIMAIYIMYAFLRVSQSLWWLYTSLVYFLVSVIFAKIFPVAIIPLFYKLTKISESPLKQRLISLADRLGIKVLDIYNIALGEKTKKANAAVCGLGSTKRIILSDTLLSGYSDDEIEVTLAHELSHHKHNHFWKLIFYNFCFTLLGFFVISLLLDGAIKSGYIKKAYDISFFPVLAVLYISYNIAVLPMFNIFSRTYETEADGDAVLFTKKADTFATLIKKLTLQNFSDPSPSFISKIFFYDHPPAQERILRAMQLKEKDK